MNTAQIQQELPAYVLTHTDSVLLLSIVTSMQEKLYVHDTTKLEAFIQNEVPSTFAPLFRNMLKSASVSEKEAYLEAITTTLGKLETLYLFLPYQPTRKQAQDFTDVFKKKYAAPFILKIEYTTNSIETLSWEYQGVRYTKSVLQSSDGPRT